MRGSGGCVVPGGHAWLLGGVCVWLPGGRAWFWGARVCAFMAPGGACVVAMGGVHGCWGACVVAVQLVGGACWLLGGHAWLLGGCMHRIRRDTVNERAVRILLECILISVICFLNDFVKNSEAV